MYTGLHHLHSLMRWVALVLIIIAVVQSFRGWKLGHAYTKGHNRMAVFTLIAFHLQLVIGLALYFISPTVKLALSNMSDAMADSVLRFFAVEHLIGMLIAIAMVTLGRVLSKKSTTDRGKHFKIAIFYAIALALILLFIPWPFTAAGAGRGWLL